MTSGPRRTGPTIVWFRQDLRLADHPALQAAFDSGQPLIPLYILDDIPTRTDLLSEVQSWGRGDASRWWLHHSLQSLDQDLRARDSRLICRRGSPLAVLEALIRESGADHVVWSRRYDPASIAQDTMIKEELAKQGTRADSFNGSLLFEPWTIKTGKGTPFQVYTPFWRACLAAPTPATPRPAPAHLPAPDRWPESDDIQHWNLRPTKPDWAGGIDASWTVGETAALTSLKHFLDDRLADYKQMRDRPDKPGTARLSPHLHFGEISPRQIWHAARFGDPDPSREQFLKELVWREFSHHLLFHFPNLPDAPLQQKFIHFPWRDSESDLSAWQKGQTGYPIVDAGMRELWQTGWMHNRVRMIVGSFLIKDLGLHWRHGQAWFWDTLVDADLANNAAGWQWIAGCGADAAPFFRIFNPVSQGERFDPDGTYVRQYVPELAAMPAKWLHRPWEAPEDVRQAAGVVLGTTYPAPIVDHSARRQWALAAFQSLKALQ